uniref:Putative tail assembly n=1 Tax=viral metagenome TaxID=1070528 RepID=A0A6M3L0E3_9ZZZZ
MAWSLAESWGRFVPGANVTVKFVPPIAVVQSKLIAAWLKARAKMTVVMDYALNSIELEMAESMAIRPKSGRIYKRPLKTYKASAPGEAPAVYSGTLLEDLQQETTQAPWGIKGEVGVGMNAIYAKLYLEKGSPGGKIKPRPFVKPAGDKIIPLFKAQMAKVTAQMMRDMSR